MTHCHSALLLGRCSDNAHAGVLAKRAAPFRSPRATCRRHRPGSLRRCLPRTSASWLPTLTPTAPATQAGMLSASSYTCQNHKKKGRCRGLHELINTHTPREQLCSRSCIYKVQSSNKGGLQIPWMLGSDPPMGWWLGLHQPPWSFWVRFPNERNQGKQGATLCYKVPGSSRVPARWVD